MRKPKKVLMSKELKKAALEMSRYYVQLITEDLAEKFESFIKDVDFNLWEEHKRKMMNAFMYKGSEYFSDDELSRLNNYLLKNNQDALIYAEKQSFLQKIKELEEQNKDMNKLNQELFRDVKRLTKI